MADVVLPLLIAPDAKPRAEWGKLLSSYPAVGYHSDREAVSQGCLRRVVTHSPQHFLAEWRKPYIEEANTGAAANGTLVHAGLLEHAEFKKYIVQPNLGDGRTKDGKAARVKFMDELPDEWVDTIRDEETGKEKREINGKAKIVSASDHYVANAMIESVLNNKRVRALGLFDGTPLTEQTIFWVDPETRLLNRSRLDLVSRKHKIVVDVKTTEDASRGPFGRSIHNNLYHFQGASYLKAAATADPELADAMYVFIAVERTPPFAVAVYVLNPRALAVGESLRSQASATLAECIKTSTWPGYSEKVENIDLPAYAYNGAAAVEF